MSSLTPLHPPPSPKPYHFFSNKSIGEKKGHEEEINNPNKKLCKRKKYEDRERGRYKERGGGERYNLLLFVLPLSLSPPTPPPPFS